MEKESIQDIQIQLRFLATLEVFFFAFIYGFFIAMGNNEIISNKNASIWALGVGATVLSYLSIELINRHKAWVWIKAFIYINFLCLASLMIITALIQNKPLPGYYYWPFVISLWGSGIMPMVMFSFIIAILAYQIFWDILDLIKNKK